MLGIRSKCVHMMPFVIRGIYFLKFNTAALVNPLNAELNPVRHLLALVGVRHIVHVSKIRVNPFFCGVFHFCDSQNENRD